MNEPAIALKLSKNASNRRKITQLKKHTISINPPHVWVFESMGEANIFPGYPGVIQALESIIEQFKMDYQSGLQKHMVCKSTWQSLSPTLLPQKTTKITAN